jgi:Fe-S-cluster containining protein
LPEKVIRTRLDAAPPTDPCDGCTECALRCAGGIPLTRREFDGVVAYLRSLPPEKVRRVLEQEKILPWFEDISREACLFLDLRDNYCLIYPARPMICRLFGRVEWLPCPAEKAVSQLHDGLGIIRDYSREPRKTFPEWQAEAGLFDLKDLLKKA